MNARVGRLSLLACDGGKVKQMRSSRPYELYLFQCFSSLLLSATQGCNQEKKRKKKPHNPRAITSPFTSFGASEHHKKRFKSSEIRVCLTWSIFFSFSFSFSDLGKKNAFFFTYGVPCGNLSQKLDQIAPPVPCTFSSPRRNSRDVW